MVTIAPEQHLQILHLEDSLADQDLVQRILHKAYPLSNVIPVDTLELFEELISKNRFDIILADYRLNGFTALDAWQCVARSRHPSPFILVSGAIGEAAAVDAMRLGISDYLLKDDITRLPHVVARAMEVHQAKREREAAVAELAESQKRLVALTAHLQSSIENERASIAREIHDDIGGALTAVRFDVSWISRHAPDMEIQRHANAAVEMLQHAIGASQRIMMDLRPPVLEQGLVAAIRWLVLSFERRTGVPVRLSVSSEDMPVHQDIQVVAYRTTQESLTNITKYANATQVSIDLSDQENVLTLEIADNGYGIPSEDRNKPKAFGLKGLQERARIAGGWLDIGSQVGKGTCITLTVPLISSRPTDRDEVIDD
jgi:signal transduction histidine kinase